MADACQYDPEDVDNAVSPRVKKILKDWEFCVGFTAQSHGDMSLGGFMRIVQWRDRECSAKTEL